MSIAMIVISILGCKFYLMIHVLAVQIQLVAGSHVDFPGCLEGSVGQRLAVRPINNGLLPARLDESSKLLPKSRPEYAPHHR